MLEPKGRVIMVSGASRGIGRAIAQRLIDDGYGVSLGVRDPDAVASSLGAHALCCRFVAEDRSSHASWLATTLDRFGRLDGLVNNAGVGGKFTVEEGEEAELDRIFTINVKAPLFLTRLCLPHLKTAGSGRIVNVASLSGKRVRNDSVAYSMSKYALIALTHTTRRLGWEHGVRVTALCPSFVRTDMTASVTKLAREEMIDPADLAAMAAMAIGLPNNAAIAELLVNCRLEDTL